MSESKLRPPEPLGEKHDLGSFCSGIQSLDDWLTRQAAKNETSGSSRTYVVCDGSIVVGYYCLAAGAVVRSIAPKILQRNAPDPVPVIVLGRLAVDER